jgi:hypothetical protein
VELLHGRVSPMTDWQKFYHDWTDEERHRAVYYAVNGHEYWTYLFHAAANDNFDKADEVRYNRALSDIVLLWKACNYDMVLTRLSYEKEA